MFYVMATSCSSRVYGVEMTYNFMNPGGEALSTTQIPFKSVTIVMAGLWGLIAVIWAVNRCGNGHVRP